MTLGRKPESVPVPAAEAARGRGGSPGAGVAGRQLQSAHRRGLGCRGQHLRLRWLRQLAHREVRQERQVSEILGLERNGAGPVRHAALDRDRCARQCLRRRSRQQAHSGLRQRRHLQDQIHERRRSLGDLHFSRRASVSVQLQLQWHGLHGQRRNLQDGAGRPDPRQVRHAPASCSRNSAPSTRSIAAIRTSSMSARSPTGECRS